MELTKEEVALIEKRRSQQAKKNKTTEPVKMFVITAILSPVVWYLFNFLHIYLYIAINYHEFPFWYPLWEAFIGFGYMGSYVTPVILLAWTLVMFTGPMLVLSYLRYKSFLKKGE